MIDDTHTPSPMRSQKRVGHFLFKYTALVE